MGRLSYLKGERSSARKELKKYLIMCRDFIAEESNIDMPSKEEIKKFSSEEFDAWFETIIGKLSAEQSKDFVLTELVENYICSCNNVAIEETSSKDVYF